MNSSSPGSIRKVDRTVWERKHGQVETVVLIGGGDLMLRCVPYCRDAGWQVTVILASRHAEALLHLDGRKARDAFDETGVEVIEVEDINAWSGLKAATPEPEATLALCFGPAWVFSQTVMERFGAGMINFNGIPVPRYLGGAHYTWQILNNDKTGACVLQEITEDVDRGPILKRHDFQHSGEVRLPRDYFVSNIDEACLFMRDAIADMGAGKSFHPADFAELESERLSFPRLMTLGNGLINWSWDAEAIVRFCCAFDDPFPGATTFLGETRVHVRDARLDRSIPDLHPFTAGLIVRCHQGRVWIAARDGMVVTPSIVDDDGNNFSATLTEGARLFTPRDLLDAALTYRPHLTGGGVKV